VQAAAHYQSLPAGFVTGATEITGGIGSGFVYGLAFTSDGTRLLVPDYANGRLVCFDAATGAVLWVLGKEGRGDGEFGGPRCVLVLPGGAQIMVVDTANHRLQWFDLETQRHGRTVGGAEGSGEGQFYAPGGACVTAGGAIAVVELNNHRVQILTAEGVFVRAFGEEGAGDGQLSFPYSIALSLRSGHLLVADKNNDRVAVWTEDGQWVGTIGEGQGDGAGQLSGPTSVEADAAGLVLVGEGGNGRVSVFREEGGAFVCWLGGPAALGEPNASGYIGLAVDARTGALAVCSSEMPTRVLVHSGYYDATAVAAGACSCLTVPPLHEFICAPTHRRGRR
jgi:DNA-binding beta-propeller fold protein YncE